MITKEMAAEAITLEIEKFNFKNNHKAFIYRIISVIGLNTDVMPQNVVAAYGQFYIEYPYDISLIHYPNNQDFKYGLWKSVDKSCYFNIDTLQEAESIANYISMVLEMANNKYNIE